jgi:hypothetical protein
MELRKEVAENFNLRGRLGKVGNRCRKRRIESLGKFNISLTLLDIGTG